MGVCARTVRPGQSGVVPLESGVAKRWAVLGFMQASGAQVPITGFL